MYREEETSFYDLLEVGPEAGPSEIYEAYQRARETYSPQSAAIYSMFTEAEARELLKIIDEAYSTLSNRSSKRAYDLKLGFIQEHEPVSEAVVNPPPRPPIAERQSVVEEKKVGTPLEGWSGVIKVYKKAEMAVPAGKGRTRFGLYDVDENFEHDINSVEECDGSFLQRIREYRKVPLADLSEAMKISKSVLVSLEENDLKRLPVLVFTRGIVVQYCRMLMLDENKLVDAYMTYFKSQQNPT